MKKLHFAALLCALSAPAIAQDAPPPAPPSAPEPSPPASAVADAVAADFPKYDKDKSGELSKAEFSAWISEAKSQAGGKAPDKQALGDAFMKADADKSKTVSAAELTSFLS
jgi:hypothetical protein